jgi:hypothetical protein
MRWRGHVEHVGENMGIVYTVFDRKIRREEASRRKKKQRNSFGWYTGKLVSSGST